MNKQKLRQHKVGATKRGSQNARTNFRKQQRQARHKAAHSEGRNLRDGELKGPVPARVESAVKRKERHDAHQWMLYWHKHDRLTRQINHDKRRNARSVPPSCLG